MSSAAPWPYRPAHPPSGGQTWLARRPMTAEPPIHLEGAMAREVLTDLRPAQVVLTVPNRPELPILPLWTAVQLAGEVGASLTVLLQSRRLAYDVAVSTFGVPAMAGDAQRDLLADVADELAPMVWRLPWALAVLPVLSDRQIAAMATHGPRTVVMIGHLRTQRRTARLARRLACRHGLTVHQLCVCPECR